ncbi:hypothetical protein L208DRAFT_1384380 [Tricholoma matsutake]|nr:hypothetical protein L208DRAFT_1384380 [Tricholoma matsutake 945]
MAPPTRVLGLIAVMCESFLVGAYAALAVVVLWLLISRRRTMSIMHKALFLASIVMFLVSVADLALVVQQVAIVKMSLVNARTRIILSVIQFIIGDLVLIWRVWVVWGHSYWIALGPLIIMIISAGFAFSLASSHDMITFFIATPSALIVANTIICTLLIAGRIWYTRYQVHQISGGRVYDASRFSKIVLLFIETGALYTASHLVALILNHFSSPAIHIILDLGIPLIGILPTLIIVLVHFELVRSPQQSSSARPHTIRFEDRSRITQLDAFARSIAHSEDTHRPKSQALNIV